MTIYRNISNHVAKFNGVEFAPGESKDVDFFTMSPYMVEVRNIDTIGPNEDKPKRRYRKSRKQDDAPVSDLEIICGDTSDAEMPDGNDNDGVHDPVESEQETSNIE